MNYVPVILEEVGQKYCKPRERIIHEYYVQTQRLREGMTAYRRSLYTEEYDFSCDRFHTLDEARKWKKDFEREFPDVKTEIRELTDDQIYQESTACLKRN